MVTGISFAGREETPSPVSSLGESSSSSTLSAAAAEAKGKVRGLATSLFSRIRSAPPPKPVAVATASHIVRLPEGHNVILTDSTCFDHMDAPRAAGALDRDMDRGVVYTFNGKAFSSREALDAQLHALGCSDAAICLTHAASSQSFFGTALGELVPTLSTDTQDVMINKDEGPSIRVLIQVTPDGNALQILNTAVTKVVYKTEADEDGFRDVGSRADLVSTITIPLTRGRDDPYSLRIRFTVTS